MSRWEPEGRYHHRLVIMIMIVIMPLWLLTDIYFLYTERWNRQLRARRALLQLKDVPLRTRRALLLYKVYGNSALLVLNGTSLIALAPFWLSADKISNILYYFLTLSQASECKSCTKFGQVEELMGRDNAEQAPMDDWIWYAVTKWTKRDWCNIAQYRTQYKTCSNITKRDLWCFSEHVHIDMSYYEISKFPISLLYVDMLWEFTKMQQQNAYLNYICQLYFVFVMFILDNWLVVDHSLELFPYTGWPRKNAPLSTTNFKEISDLIKLVSAVMSRTFFSQQNDTKINDFDEGLSHFSESMSF